MIFLTDYFELDTATHETGMNALKQMSASMCDEDVSNLISMTREQCHAELDRQLDDEEKSGGKILGLWSGRLRLRRGIK